VLNVGLLHVAFCLFGDGSEVILSFQKTMTQENWTDHIQVSMDFPLPFSESYLLGDCFKMFRISRSGYCSPTITILYFLITL